MGMKRPPRTKRGGEGGFFGERGGYPRATFEWKGGTIEIINKREMPLLMRYDRLKLNQGPTSNPSQIKCIIFLANKVENPK